MASYRLSEEASVDLDAISDFILEDNPLRALTFVDELIERFRVIAERPLSFPARDDLGTGLRSAVHGSYLILFRVEDDAVLIVRVIHGARDIPNLL